MKCRGCRRDRFHQQPKPKPWVLKGQWPAAEQSMREQKGPLVRQQVQAGPARAAARPPKELRMYLECQRSEVREGDPMKD
eukprot:6761150-Alexandrium_andersonii.AAC.1